jgi:alkanesulfonate monooxygenase SsuD/methylene tetrahydromethanopterin reductase-like flavin-dependent oxidoreductase (luciferase family)
MLHVQAVIPLLGSGSGLKRIQHRRRSFAYLLNRSPTDNSRQKDRLDYWIWLAKLAEKGKITSVFIADSYAGHNIYGGSADASYKGGSHIGKLDPLMTVSAMAGK